MLDVFHRGDVDPPFLEPARLALDPVSVLSQDPDLDPLVQPSDFRVLLARALIDDRILIDGNNVRRITLCDCLFGLHQKGCRSGRSDHDNRGERTRLQQRGGKDQAKDQGRDRGDPDRAVGS